MTTHKDVIEMLKRHDVEEIRLIKKLIPEEIELLMADIKDLNLLVMSNRHGINLNNYQTRYNTEAKNISKDLVRLGFDIKRLDASTATKYGDILKSLLSSFRAVTNTHKSFEPAKVSRSVKSIDAGNEKYTLSRGMPTLDSTVGISETENVKRTIADRMSAIRRTIVEPMRLKSPNLSSSPNTLSLDDQSIALAKAIAKEEYQRVNPNTFVSDTDVIAAQEREIAYYNGKKGK